MQIWYAVMGMQVPASDYIQVQAVLQPFWFPDHGGRDERLAKQGVPALRSRWHMCIPTPSILVSQLHTLLKILDPSAIHHTLPSAYFSSLLLPNLFYYKLSALHFVAEYFMVSAIIIYLGARAHKLSVSRSVEAARICRSAAHKIGYYLMHRHHAGHRDFALDSIGV